MLHDVVIVGRTLPVIHAASHFYHEKRVAWVSISLHACESCSYSYGASLGGPLGHQSSAKNFEPLTM